MGDRDAGIFFLNFAGLASLVEVCPLPNAILVEIVKYSSKDSGVGTGGSGGSRNRGPELMGPRIVEPPKIFRQDS